jgi:hypothetical protein
MVGVLRRAGTVIAIAAMVAITAPVVDPAGAATLWSVPLAVGSSGEPRSGTAPAAPTGVTAACAGLLIANRITITWTAVVRATAYNVYQSTTAATGPYTLVQTVSTATWTTAALASGPYWYEVSAAIGSQWVGPQSTATAQRTITLALLCL